jgi:hypothetical protein
MQVKGKKLVDQDMKQKQPILVQEKKCKLKCWALGKKKLPDTCQSLWSEQGFHIVAFIGSFHKSLGSGLVSA